MKQIVIQAEAVEKNNSSSTNIVKILKNGGVGVMPTDTLYGVVGSALNKKAVEKIYKLKKRNPTKPLIVLIPSIKDLEIFHPDIHLDVGRPSELKIWPAKTSIILPVKVKKFEYLHRGTNSIAFRLPKNEKLIEILKKTGPLVAPSANTEGNPPAKNIEEARKYFGGYVDFYVSGKVSKKPSKLLKYDEKSKKFLRIR